MANRTLSVSREVAMRWVSRIQTALVATLPSISPFEGRCAGGFAAEPPSLLAPEGRDVATATVRGETLLTKALAKLNCCFTLTAPFGASLPQAGENIGSKPQGQMQYPP